MMHTIIRRTGKMPTSRGGIAIETTKPMPKIAAQRMTDK